MHLIGISELHPDEPPPSGRTIRAIVTLLWPYSSITRQYTVLLADQDFRLRRHRGQVRVCFNGAIGAAIAEQKLRIGDEVILALKGAKWKRSSTQDQTLTPGKSVEAELDFGEELDIRVNPQTENKHVLVSGRSVLIDNNTSSELSRRTPLSANPKEHLIRSSTLYQGDDVAFASPLFAKQSKLSRDNLFDIISDEDWEASEHQRKRRRTTFGEVKGWRYSPEAGPPPDTEPRDTGVANSRASSRLGGASWTSAHEATSTLDSRDQDVSGSVRPLIISAFESGDLSPQSPSPLKFTTPNTPTPAPRSLSSRLATISPSSKASISLQEKREKTLKEEAHVLADQQPAVEGIESHQRAGDRGIQSVREQLVDAISESKDRHAPTPGVSKATDVQQLSASNDIFAPDHITPELQIMQESSASTNTLPFATPSRTVEEKKLPPLGISNNVKSIHTPTPYIPTSSTSFTTPESEKAKVMSQTYDSLFGFNFSPAPFKSRVERKADQQKARGFLDTSSNSMLSSKEAQDDHSAPAPTVAAPIDPQGSFGATSSQSLAPEGIRNTSELADDESTTAMQLAVVDGYPTQRGISEISSTPGLTMDRVSEHQLSVPELSWQGTELPLTEVYGKTGKTGTEFKGTDKIEQKDPKSAGKIEEHGQEQGQRRSSAPVPPTPQGSDMTSLVEPEESQLSLPVDHPAQTIGSGETSRSFDGIYSMPVSTHAANAAQIPTEFSDLQKKFVPGDQRVQDHKLAQSNERAAQSQGSELPRDVLANTSQTRADPPVGRTDDGIQADQLSAIPALQQTDLDATQKDINIAEMSGTLSNREESADAASLQPRQGRKTTNTMAENENAATPSREPTSRRSFAPRLNDVPEVVQTWFSPRRTGQLRPNAKVQKLTNNDAMDSAVEIKEANDKHGTKTDLSYFVALSTIEQRVNAPSAAYGPNTVDVLAVVVDEPHPPKRAQSGPKDFYTVFSIIDPSLQTGQSVSAQIFRPWQAKLPTAHAGDVILLRSFVVKSRNRQGYLLSGDASAWCVWRYARDASRQGTDDDRREERDRMATTEEVKGPPVEMGDEERQRAQDLRRWWRDMPTSWTKEEKQN